VAATVFQGIQMLLYDPDASTVELLPDFDDKVVHRHRPAAETALRQSGLRHTITVLTSDAGWFDDPALEFLKAHVLPAQRSRPTLLFVSDIRGPTSETDIVRDMLDQQRWTLALSPSAYMLKFRVPFDPSLYTRYTVPGLHVEKAAQQIPYLDGQLRLQLYPPPNSAELRLVAVKAPPRFRLYSPPDIEARMAIFNAVHRSHSRFRFGPRKGQAFETLAEYAILRRCAQAVSRAADIERVQQGIEDLLAQKISKTPATCSFQTAIKTLRARPDPGPVGR
jgi:hypothetical protein